jgi:hypothetical protein
MSTESQCRNHWGDIVWLVHKAMTELGAMALEDLCAEIKIADRRTVHAAVARLRRPAPKLGRPRLVRISGWISSTGTGTRAYPRPVYAIGDEPDARRPPTKTAAKVRKETRWRMKSSTLAAMPFATKEQRQAAFSAQVRAMG